MASTADKPVYGEINDRAYKVREAKILSSNASTVDKGQALRAAKIEAAAKGEKWTPGLPASKAAAIAETRDEVAVPPKVQGAVYGGMPDDCPYKIRQAKILASNAPTADKGQALREAKAEAAAKGEEWTPEVESKGVVAEVAPKAQGNLYGEIDDAAWKAREAKILASDAPTVDKGQALRLAKAEAAAKGEAWTPNVPGTS